MIFNRRSFLAASASGLTMQGFSAEQSSGPLVVGNRACLFLDDRFVAERAGLKRVWHQGKPLADPAIVADRPWDTWPHLFGSVFHDARDGVFRMWYTSVNAPGKKPEDLILYAESRDGRSWTKPNLGEQVLNGSKENNCVLLNAGLPCVYLDPRDTDPRGRFKMFTWLMTGKRRLAYLRSADGIRWEEIGPGPSADLIGPADRFTTADTNIVLWDTLGQRYLSAYRTYPQHKIGFRQGRRRGVGITTSDQPTSGWKTIKTVFRTDDQDDALAAQFGKGPEPDWAEPYSMPIYPYGNHYLGMVSLLYYVDGKDTTIGGDLQLTFSQDGFVWERPKPRQSIVTTEKGWFPCYATCNPPLDLGDEMVVYYSEADCAHPTAQPRSRIRGAAFRKDGFVSLAAGEEMGTLTTPPLKWEGQRLAVNAAVAKGGRVRVGLLDAAGKPLPGFDLGSCDVIQGTSQIVSWNDEKNLSKHKGKAVRLTFTLGRSHLYAFRFV